MGARPRQVGGGTATPVANNWNNFLNQQLGMAPATQVPDSFYNALSNLPGGQQLANNIRQQQSNQQQPQQQTGAFQNAFGGALGGQVNDLSGAGGFLQNFFQNPSNQFSNQYQNQQFQGADLSQLPTNFGQGQTGMADLSGFGNPAQSGFNTQQQLMDPRSSNFDSMLMNMIQSGGQQQGQSGFMAASAGPGVELAPGMSYEDAYNTLGQDPLMERNRMKAIADQRARFGAEGAGALGTGAQYAESNLNAELNALDASQRRGQSMQLMGQDLSERMGAANTALGSRGQDVQVGLGNMQGGIQGAANINQFNTANLGNMLSAATQGRGQDFNTGLGMRGQDLSQLGMGADQSMFNAGQSNNMQSNMLQATLANQGMGNNFGLGAQGLNNQAMQNNNANSIGMAGMQNNFNIANAGNMAQFGNAAQQGNAGFLQNMISQGMGMNQMGNNNTMNMLNQLFGGMMQSNAIGNPQAQIAMQPSAAGQMLNMGLGLAGSYFGGGGGFGGFGGMGGGPVPGNFGGYNPNTGGPQFRMPQPLSFSPFGQTSFSGMPMFQNANFGIG